MAYRHIVLLTVRDTRKGTVVVEDLTFVDGAAYERFRTSRDHGRITSLMAGMADWVVVTT